MKPREIEAIVKRGHRIASGQATDSPYPKGSIEMQRPCFAEGGLDLRGCFPATLNLSIAPYRFTVKSPDHHFRKVHWAEGFPPEDFLFIRCALRHRGAEYPAFVYYPDPATKIGHFQDDATLEVIAEPIDGLDYGDKVVIVLDPGKIEIL